MVCKSGEGDSNNSVVWAFVYFVLQSYVSVAFVSTSRKILLSAESFRKSILSIVWLYVADIYLPN